MRYTNKSILLGAIACLWLSCSSLAFSQAMVEKLGSAFPLFNGQDTSSWSQAGNANWHPITPNGIAAEQGSGLLVGRLPVTDFQLQFNFWLSKNTKFSIYAHCTDANYISSNTALEINLSSIPINQYKGGSVIGLWHATSSPILLNQWNDVTITSISNQLSVTINGVTTVDKINYNQFLSGPFAIKYDGGKLNLTNLTATIPGRW